MTWTNTELTEVRSIGDDGRGLFARTAIPEGTVLAIFDGRAVSFEARPGGEIDFGTEDPRMLLHLGIVEGRFYAIAPISYDGVAGADFMNHSCRPNCRVERLLMVRADTDIAAGEELTWDYRTWDVVTLGETCWCEPAECVI